MQTSEELTPSAKAREATLVDLASHVEELNAQGLNPYRDEGNQFENDLRKERLDGLKQNREQRGMYAPLIIWLPVGWVAAVLLIVLFSGISIVPFSLSDEILMALIGSMTLSVFRPLLVVTDYLFSKRE